MPTPREEIGSIVQDNKATDPAVGDFLGILTRDIHGHPDRIRPMDPSLAARTCCLTEICSRGRS